MSPERIDLKKLANVKDGGFEDEPFGQDRESRYSDSVMREANDRKSAIFKI